ncbi:MAG: bifunctional metallophosphatase/5'-nucleotidase [Candidatus Limisoma sp.]
MKTTKLFIATIAALTISAAAQAESLVIMHSNDVHGHVAVEKVKDDGGSARMKVVIDSIRAAEKHTLLVDAGDDVQGYLYFNVFGGEVEYNVMNILGYDIAIPGNHEFDNGIEALAKNYKRLKATKLSANYDFRRTPVKGVKEYAIKKFCGRRIAFIGVGCQPKGMISDKNCVGMGYRDAIAVADSLATVLKTKKKADLVVVLSHIGYVADEPWLPNDTLLAKNSTDIDVIIGGHSHTVIDPRKGDVKNVFTNRAGKKVLVAQTGRYGRYLGKITIDLDNITEMPRSELIAINSRLDSRSDGSVERFLKPYTAEVDKLAGVVIGRSEAEFPNGEMNPLSNWVADKILEIGTTLTDRKIDFAVGNKGGVRRPLTVGDVTMGQMLTMLPFENYATVIELSGKDIAEAFNSMAARDGDAVSAGVRAKMKDHRAYDITINGEPLDPERTYVVATLDYLANGGDNMVAFTRGKQIGMSEKQLKYNVIDIIKEMTARGESINPDTTPRIVLE